MMPWWQSSHRAYIGDHRPVFACRRRRSSLVVEWLRLSIAAGKPDRSCALPMIIEGIESSFWKSVTPTFQHTSLFLQKQSSLKWSEHRLTQAFAHGRILPRPCRPYLVFFWFSGRRVVKRPMCTWSTILKTLPTRQESWTIPRIFSFGGFALEPSKITHCFQWRFLYFSDQWRHNLLTAQVASKQLIYWLSCVKIGAGQFFLIFMEALGGHGLGWSFVLKKNTKSVFFISYTL